MKKIRMNDLSGRDRQSGDPHRQTMGLHVGWNEQCDWKKRICI